MTYNTGNSLGSTDVRDLKDNAENFDKFANGTEVSYPNRFSVPKKSIHGMNTEFIADQASRASTFTNTQVAKQVEFDADQAQRVVVFDVGQDNREAQFNTFISASGYEPPIPYAADILLDRTTKTVTYLGNEYRAKPFFIPFTTTNWATDEAKLKLVGDDSLRQELADTIDPTKGLAVLGYVREAPGVAAKKLKKLQDSRAVNPWEFDYLVTDKPTPGDPDTWDWKPAIQAALSTGRDVCLPQGRFKANKLSMMPGQTLFGEGPGSVLVQRLGHLALMTSSNDSAIRDLTLEGDYDNSVQKPFSAATAVGNGPAMDITGTNRVNVMITMRNTPVATVQLQQSTDGIAWAQVGSSYTASADHYPVVVTGPFVRLAITAYTSGDVTAYLTKAQPATETVSNSLCNAAPRTLFQNVNFKKATSTFVNAGGSTGVRVSGCFADTAGFEGFVQWVGSDFTVEYCWIKNTLKSALDSNVNNTRFIRNVIENCGTAGSIDADTGIWISTIADLTNIVVEHNYISGTKGRGINIQASGGKKISKISVCGNILDTIGSHGIYLDDTHYTSLGYIEHYKINDNEVTKTGQMGIAVSGGVYGTINNNKVHDVLSVTVTNVAGIGLLFNFGPMHVAMSGNVVSGVPANGRGIRTEGSHFSIMGGVVVGVDPTTGVGYHNGWNGASKGQVYLCSSGFLSPSSSAGGTLTISIV